MCCVVAFNNIHPWNGNALTQPVSMVMIKEQIANDANLVHSHSRRYRAQWMIRMVWHRSPLAISWKRPEEWPHQVPKAEKAIRRQPDSICIDFFCLEGAIFGSLLQLITCICSIFDHFCNSPHVYHNHFHMSSLYNCLC